MLMVLVLRVFPSLVGCCCRSASEIYFVTPRLSLSNLWDLREAVMEDDGEIGAVFILLLLFLVFN